MHYSSGTIDDISFVEHLKRLKQKRNTRKEEQKKLKINVNSSEKQRKI